MGWKASAIIINPKRKVDYTELLQELGFVGLKKIEDETLETVIYPRGKKVYVGTYEDNLLICEQQLPTTFVEEIDSDAEKLLALKFPESEICAVVLVSTVNYWGYSIFKQGKTIRARAGSGDDGTFVEFGEPLAEEKELLGKSSIDAEGKRVYKLAQFPDEIFTEDQVGENFVFAITARYFEVEWDAMENPLFETVMTGYSFSKIENAPPDSEIIQNNMKGKPWWKFW